MLKLHAHPGPLYLSPNLEYACLPAPNSYGQGSMSFSQYEHSALFSSSKQPFFPQYIYVGGGRAGSSFMHEWMFQLQAHPLGEYLSPNCLYPVGQGAISLSKNEHSASCSELKHPYSPQYLYLVSALTSHMFVPPCVPSLQHF